MDPAGALPAVDEAAVSSVAGGGEIDEAVGAFGGRFDEAEALFAEEDDPPVAVEGMEAG